MLSSVPLGRITLVKRQLDWTLLLITNKSWTEPSQEEFRMADEMGPLRPPRV